MTSWNRTKIRNLDRGFEARHFRERLYSDEEVEWEGKMLASEAIASSLRLVTAPSTAQDASKFRRLAHLNALPKMWAKKQEDQLEDTEADHGLKLKEIMLCLRIPLVHESADIRAAALRTLRQLTKTMEDVEAIMSLNVHYLITRCLDIELDNKVERIQALKMARALAFIGQGQLFPMILLRSIVSIAEGGKTDDDRLYRAALALLCEMSVISPSIFIDSGGVKALSFCLLDTSQPKIAEAIIASLLRLHNDPVLRPQANVNFGMIVAPFTEFTYIHQFSATTDKQEISEERAQRFKCAEQAFLSAMRSWSGLIQLCQPKLVGPSNLQAVIEILYLNSHEVRQYLINMFYELLSLKAPNEANFEDALKVSDPSTFKDSWKLADGFVASEGLDILPHISKSRPNLVESHLALVLHCLLKCDLPDALVHVIVDTEDLTLSVSATVLLGELLHLANLLLPREVNVISHCLPGLLKEVSSFEPKKATRAQEAVAALHKLHAMKKRGPKASSLFLDQILANSGQYGGDCFVGDRLLWSNLHKTTNDEKIKSTIKSSSVNANYDANVWDWDLVTAIFRFPDSEQFKSLEVQEFKNFVRRVADYFKPTNGRFCRVELANPKSRSLARTGCYLLDFLVEAGSSEALRILDEFLHDIHDCFVALIDSKSLHDCLFSPTRVATTSCQYYFLFLGRLSRSDRGRSALDRIGMLGTFTQLLTLRSDLHLKLVISCLDYSAMDWGSRTVLSIALKEGSEPCKIYATKFLGMLIRSKAHNIAHWGIDMLTGQLFDQESQVVPGIALNMLDEAADDKMNLEAMVCALQNKDLSHLGIRGELLKTRLLMSSTYGLKVINNEEQLGELFRLWKTKFNEAYVLLVEDLLNDGLTRHQRDEDLSYGRRTLEAHSLRAAYLPHHLYGQLASSKLGLEALIRHPDIHEMLGVLDNAGDKQWMRTKTAMWCVANVAVSYEGSCFVDREGGIEALIKMAEGSAVLSLKATAFYALSLVATTRHGCQVLASKGWCTLKYGRDDSWPVLEDWFLRFQMATVFDHGDPDLDETNVQDETDSDKASTRSSFLLFTPGAKKDDNNGGDDYEDGKSDDIHPRSGSLSSRKRLSNLFKSLSDKRESGGGSGIKTKGSLTKKLRRSLFLESSSSDNANNEEQRPSYDFQDSYDDPGRAAPIATPEKSRSSSGETLEGIKEETEVAINKVSDINPCTTESSTTVSSEASSLMPTTTTASAGAHNTLSPIASSNSITMSRTLETTSTFVKPMRMKQRSGQRAYSESEAQTFLKSNPMSTIVSGASVTSMSSTGSYADNPGYHTLRSIHNRHRPVLDFVEQGDDHDHLLHHGQDMHHHPVLKRSDSASNKKRNPSGGAKRMSYAGTKKRLIVPLKEEDLTKTINDRYWGITLPAKMDALLNDGLINWSFESVSQTMSAVAPSSPGAFEYHNEETCLKCFSYAESSAEKLHLRHRSSSLCTPLGSSMGNEFDFSGTQSTKGSPLNLRKHIIVKTAMMDDGEQAQKRLEQRKDALKVISTLNASVGANKAEEVLLRMKQQAPTIFKDLCFYSEVCQLMSHFSFRLTSRRFIQELFMDVSFEALTDDVRALLATQKAIDEETVHE